MATEPTPGHDIWQDLIERVDPALAAGPMLTTVTDMCGFFLVLSLASSVIEHL